LFTLHPNLNFIFVTGHGAVEKSEEDGSEKDIYLSKPLDIDFLIETVQELIQAR